jgi:predicted Zn-dependent peptidase
MKMFESIKLNEKYYFFEHESGMKIFLFPKNGYSTTYAILGVKYGSINDVYKTSTGETISLPGGVAHYLEHKLFESEECDAFSLYAKTGASANAYTSFNKTGYLFSCTDNLNESLKILFKFVQNPYFTEENVEKERNIIAQEIRMFEDSPENKVMFNMLKNMYRKHPVRNDIAGTIESISEITPELLYKCYNNFYSPSNMSFCLAGRFDPNEVFTLINENIKNSPNKAAKTIFPNEPSQVTRDFISENMEVALPIFNLGYKNDAVKENMNIKELISLEITLCALMFKSERLYGTLLDENLINSSFSCEHFHGPYFSSIIFGGESSNPEKTGAVIREQTEEFAEKGLDEELFIRARNNVYSESIVVFDSTSGIANGLLDFSFSNREVFSYIENIEKITLNEVNMNIKGKFKNESSVLSVIFPK